MTSAIPIGTVLAITRDGAQHEARVHRGQRRIAEAETVEHPGTEALHQDIVTRQEAHEGRPPLGTLEVQAQAALVAVEGDEPPREPLERGREDPHVIAHVGILELVHAGTEIREDEGAEGTG